MHPTIRPRRHARAAWAFAGILALLVACTTPPPPTVEAPEITAFTASPDQVAAGGASTLSWTVVGEATLALRDGSDAIDVADGADFVIVNPTATTTYTLTATNDGGSDSATATVTVVAAAPEITSFTANPNPIGEGDTTTLSWTVVGTATLALSDGTDPVDLTPGATSVVVSPTATTTYTLTATNAVGSDSADVTVTVDPDLVLPGITAFTATPATIDFDASSTLAWTVVGADSVALDDGTDPVAIGPTDTSVVVSPTATTTYTLTATNGDGSVTDTVTVTVNPPPAPTLTGLTAVVVLGSQVQLDWTVTDATAVDVLTVANADLGDEALVTSLAGSAETYTMAIPVSARQVLRVCARGALPADDECADVTPANVVVNAGDYDPYVTPYWEGAAPGPVPEPTVPGTLRAVLAAAAPNAVIGFAADVTDVDLYGVALYPPGTAQIDAHLVIAANVTVSGPATGVTLTGRSGYDVGVDPDDGAGGFTYRSRMLYVAPGATVVLENLTLTGGDFIYKGGGIRNDGDLTGRNLVVTGNRAWDQGGGVYNVGDLTLEDSFVTNNRAVTEVAEVGGTYDIRGGFIICMIRSGFGGGLFNQPGGTITLVDTVVSGNEAMVSGGGLYLQPGSTVTMTGGSIADNVANHVPYTSDPAFPDPPLFADPDDGCDTDASAFEPYSIGGGLYNGGVFTMTGGTILENQVNAAGGGLFIDRNLQLTTLTDVLVQGNVAGVDAVDGFGGGIQHEYYEVDGPTSNYAPTNVTYGTGNTPQDYTPNEYPGAAPTAFGPSPAPEALPGRYVPNPNAIDR